RRERRVQPVRTLTHLPPKGGGCDPHPTRTSGAACGSGGGAVVARCDGCDPHPTRTSGAAVAGGTPATTGTGCCDPHPTRTSGAACGSGGGAVVARCDGCDPHPTRTSGAAVAGGTPATTGTGCCDPHPTRTSGAAHPHRCADQTGMHVAILTRRERRVQRGCW